MALFLIIIALVAIAFLALAVGVLIKGRFPDTHISHNPHMKKLGITCAQDESGLCQGRGNTVDACKGCACMNDICSL